MPFALHAPLDDPDQPLRARGLRYILLHELQGRPEMTVAEMVGALAGYGFALPGRASKVISDSLRWEVRRGRVTRLRRGLYRYRPSPRTTMRRVAIFAELAKTWVTAHTSGGIPPPTPTNRRPVPHHGPQPASRPPWAHLGWLWTT